MLLLWLVIRWQRVRDDRSLIALGLVIGIAAMTKCQVILLCLVLLVAMASLGPRDLLRRPLFWAGASLAASMATPTLIWQQLHGWPQLRMTPVVAGEAEALYGGRTGIAVELPMFAGLAGVVLGMYGLVRLLLRLRTAPVAATATFHLRPPTATWCSTWGAARISRARTSTTPVGSVTSARTCTPSSSPARVCRGKPCGPD